MVNLRPNNDGFKSVIRNRYSINKFHNSHNHTKKGFNTAQTQLNPFKGKP